jgi:pseudouridine-5'-phosphate glycosidase
MLEGTGGASLRANLAAVRHNMELGAQIAVAWHERSAH